MAEYRCRLPTDQEASSSSSSSSSAEWIEWNQQAVERARHFSEQQVNNTATTTNRIGIAPFLQHLTYRDYDHLYEPAEDTYLLLDALQYEVEQQNHHHHHNDGIVMANPQEQVPVVLVCLGIGCGTGVVSAALQPLWSGVVIVLATDVNPYAVASAQTLGVQVIQCDLAQAIRGPVDRLIFNPPYVPTPNDEIAGNGIQVSWDGGTDGRMVIDRWVEQTLVPLLARPYGISYLVTVDENRPEQLADRLWAAHGLIMRPLFRRRAKNEFLTVQKITWKPKP
jgi:release factor glutamine methyltransferase